MELLNKVFEVAAAQSKRFPLGDEPFKIVSRLLEECGEVSWELNHYERKNISIEKECKENKENLVNEAYQVLIVLSQLIQYFNLTDEFSQKIKTVYNDYQEKGFIK